MAQSTQTMAAISPLSWGHGLPSAKGSPQPSADQSAHPPEAGRSSSAAWAEGAPPEATVAPYVWIGLGLLVACTAGLRLFGWWVARHNDDALD